MLTGSDLAYYANFDSLEMRTSMWDPEFKRSLQGRRYLRRMTDLVARQRDGILGDVATLYDLLSSERDARANAALAPATMDSCSCYQRWRWKFYSRCLSLNDDLVRRAATDMALCLRTTIGNQVQDRNRAFKRPP